MFLLKGQKDTLAVDRISAFEITSEGELQGIWWLLLDNVCSWLFLLFLFFTFLASRHQPQINHTCRLICTYQCPALSWLISKWFFLSYIITSTFYLWPFFSFSYLCNLAFLLSSHLSEWVGGWPILILLLAILPDFCFCLVSLLVSLT